MWRHTYIHTYIHTYSLPIREKTSRTCPAHVPQMPPPEGGPGRGLRSVRGAALVMCKKYTANIKIINYVG